MTLVRYRLEVVTDEPPERVDLLHRNIRRHGTVYNTLAAARDVDGGIVAIQPRTNDMPVGFSSSRSAPPASTERPLPSASPRSATASCQESKQGRSSAGRLGRLRLPCSPRHRRPAWPTPMPENSR